MTQEVEVNDAQKSEDSKKSKNEPQTKVVVRRLPPTLTNELFLESIEPLAPYNYYYYVNGEDNTITPVFSRAYINFVDLKDVWIFQEKFDGYVFMDNKGNEYPAVVEYAPFSKIPKNVKKKPDARINTIENDAEYLKFLNQLNNPENEPTKAPETTVEEIQLKEKELKSNKGLPKVRTPLVDFLFRRKEEKEIAYKQAREEGRKKDIERQKLRDERRDSKNEIRNKHNRDKKNESCNKSNKEKEVMRDTQYRNKPHAGYDKESRENMSKSSGKTDNKESNKNIFWLMDILSKNGRDKKKELDVGNDDKPKEGSKETNITEANMSFTETIISQLNESKLKQLELDRSHGDNSMQVIETKDQNNENNYNNEKISLNSKWNEFRKDSEASAKKGKEHEMNGYDDNAKISIKNKYVGNSGIANLPYNKNCGDTFRFVDNKTRKSIYDERSGSTEIKKTVKNLTTSSCESIDKTLTINEPANRCKDDANDGKDGSYAMEDSEVIAMRAEIEKRTEEELARKKKKVPTATRR